MNTLIAQKIIKHKTHQQELIPTNASKSNESISSGHGINHLIDESTSISFECQTIRRLQMLASEPGCLRQ